MKSSNGLPKEQQQVSRIKPHKVNVVLLVNWTPTSCKAQDSTFLTTAAARIVALFTSSAHVVVLSL